jgi:hypothetical protein
MKKKGLLMVVALLAMASIMAAMAFNSATITSNGNITIKNTAESLVGLQNNTFYTGELGNKDATVQIVDGKMVFNFGWGGNQTKGLVYGQQQNSTYIWDSLFYVFTQSLEDVEVTVTATGDLANYITFGTDGAGKPGTAAWASTVTYSSKTITAGQGLCPAVKVNIGEYAKYTGSGTKINGEIVVSARAINKK